MSRQWSNMRQKQGVQGGLNQNINGKNNNNPLQQQQQQQMTAAQLTYAQKVKGRRPRQPQQQAPPNGNPQFRMVPTQQISALQPQVSALSNYAYPYNYSNLQQAQQQQQRRQAPPPTSSQTGQTSSSTNPYRPQRGQQRDFFDRRVQSNVNNAVSQYYNYPPSQQQQQQQINRYQQQQQQYQQQQQQYRQMNRGGFNNMNMRGPNRRNQRFRGGGGGGRGSFGQRPSYRDSQRPPFKNAPNMNRNQNKSNNSQKVTSNVKRSKPSDLQLDRYQNAADRDVLCWIFENQGKCRYGERCQWLHLDRETGQYIPTVYIMNSLSDKNMICLPVNNKDKEEEDNDDNNNNEQKEEEEKAIIDNEEEDETDPQELKNKFLLLMQEGIKKREEEEQKKLIEEDNKKDDENDDQQQNNNNNKKGKEEDDDLKCQVVDSKKKNNQNNKESKYGSYGTTFDRQNVCWEFNTFVGCRKGSSCKWAHQYLVKESAHPYTGEKLNGMAVRKFRVSNNI